MRNRYAQESFSGSYFLIYSSLVLLRNGFVTYFNGSVFQCFFFPIYALKDNSHCGKSILAFLRKNQPRKSGIRRSWTNATNATAFATLPDDSRSPYRNGKQTVLDDTRKISTYLVVTSRRSKRFNNSRSPGPLLRGIYLERHRGMVWRRRRGASIDSQGLRRGLQPPSAPLVLQLPSTASIGVLGGGQELAQDARPAHLSVGNVGLADASHFGGRGSPGDLGWVCVIFRLWGRKRRGDGIGRDGG